MQKYKDANGERLILGAKYFGYNKGVYILIEIGTTNSTLIKILSGRGVPVHKPRATSMSNAWLRRY